MTAPCRVGERCLLCSEDLAASERAWWRGNGWVHNRCLRVLPPMTADVKLPEDQNDYPLTVVAVDVEGEECYRTQVDWTGVSDRKLDNVPSSDLDERRPRWASFEVLDANGKTVHSGSNEHKDDDADESDGARSGEKARTPEAPATKKADAKSKDDEDVNANGARETNDPAAKKADAKSK